MQSYFRSTKSKVTEEELGAVLHMRMKADEPSFYGQITKTGLVPEVCALHTVNIPVTKTCKGRFYSPGNRVKVSNTFCAFACEGNIKEANEMFKAEGGSLI